MKKSLMVVALVGGCVMTVGGPALAQPPNITPVTDAVLQNPDPDDWLSWRRTLMGGATARSTR